MNGTSFPPINFNSRIPCLNKFTLSQSNIFFDLEENQNRSTLPQSDDQVIKENLFEIIEKIKNIFAQSKELSKFIPIFERNKISKKILNHINDVKTERIRRTAAELNVDNEGDVVIQILLQGRKRKGSSDIGDHTKNSSDNIMKKITLLYFDYLVKSINEILKDNNLDYSFIKLSSSFIDTLKRKTILKYLDMTLEKILSQDISSKYSLKEREYNKKIMEEILENFNDLKDIFELKFRDWINEFIMAKEPGINNGFRFKGLVGLLSKILGKYKNDEQYCVDFVYLMYHYEKWFKNRRVRNSRTIKQKSIL